MSGHSRQFQQSRREFTQMIAAATFGYEAESFASRLVDQVKALLDARAVSVVKTFLQDWPAKREWRRVVPSSLSVSALLGELKASAPAFSAALVGELRRLAPRLAWRQSYNVAEVGPDFLKHYGWTELVGLHGALASTRLASGFLLLGAATYYPRHLHEAEEIYVPLVGTAHWQQGDGLWREKEPGTVIHHARHEPHAMRTGGEPLLALYLWRSANLNQKSRLI